jgi:hypothetical protein
MFAVYTSKHMTKFILLLIVLTGAGLTTFAQTSKLGNFSLGVDGALPTYTERQIFNVAAGGSFQFQYKIFSHLYVNAIGGFESFETIKHLESVNVISNYDYVPLKAGLRGYVKWGLFMEANAGTCIYCQHGGGHGDDFMGGIGCSFKKGFELSFHYEEWKQEPEHHVSTQLGRTGPFVSPDNFGQIAVRLSERF